MHADRLNHPASAASAFNDASVWSAFFPRIAVDERASNLARDDFAAHSDADEYTARAVPVGLCPEALDGSRLTTLHQPVRRSA